MGRRLEYEVKTSVRLNMSNPQHVKINDVIQNLDPKIFKSKNQFIIDAIQFYIDNYGKETFVIKKKEKERAEYIRSEDIDDIKEEVIEAATNEAKDTYYCCHWCGWCHHSCKECYGVRTSLPAAGFIYHELCTERNCSRCHDGWYFNSTDILRILRWGKKFPF